MPHQQAGEAGVGGFEGIAEGVPIGLGYVHSATGVDAATLGEGRFELDVAGQRVPATLSLRPHL